MCAINIVFLLVKRMNFIFLNPDFYFISKQIYLKIYFLQCRGFKDKRMELKEEKGNGRFGGTFFLMKLDDLNERTRDVDFKYI